MQTTKCATENFASQAGGGSFNMLFQMPNQTFSMKVRFCCGECFIQCFHCLDYVLFLFFECLTPRGLTTIYRQRPYRFPLYNTYPAAVTIPAHKLLYFHIILKTLLSFYEYRYLNLNNSKYLQFSVTHNMSKFHIFLL